MIATRDGWRYGLFGLPLAFAALPVYVHLPALYGDRGVPLAELGLLLLALRLADAVFDPWIGRWIDRAFRRSLRWVLACMGVAALLLACGFALAFQPPRLPSAGLLAWCAAALVLTYLAFSVLTVSHHAWGAMLASDDVRRARVVAWREGLGLAGVLLAAVLPTAAGWPATIVVLALLLFAGFVVLSRSRYPVPLPQSSDAAWSLPWTRPGFRRLLAVFVINGIASAVPATLLVFFVRDRLWVPDMEGAFLAIYFACGALSLPLWLRAVRRAGLARAWLAGMLLAVAAFSGAMVLGPGNAVGFMLVCALSGLALGSDLALPAALVARAINEAGDSGRAEGVYFGWWNFATKLNLALAAGVALPLLGLAGYTPGDRSPSSAAALTLAYCALPCVLKLAAALLLYLLFVRPELAE